MKEKRRDSKGRILHTGESQRTDGKYLYKIFKCDLSPVHTLYPGFSYSSRVCDYNGDL